MSDKKVCLVEGQAYCVCKACGYSEDATAETVCSEKTCPECGKPLTGSDEKPAAKAEPEPKEPSEESRGAWKKLRDAFPEDKEFAVEAFDKGLSLAAAQTKYFALIQARLKDRDAEMQKLRDENAAIRKQLLGGEGTPVPPSGEINPAAGGSFRSIVRAYQKEKDCTFSEAVQMCRLTHPKEFKATRDAGLI